MRCSHALTDARTHARAHVSAQARNACAKMGLSAPSAADLGADNGVGPESDFGDDLTFHRPPIIPLSHVISGI